MIRQRTGKHPFAYVLLIASVMLTTACSSTPEKGPVNNEQEENLVQTYISAAGIYLQQGKLQYAKEKIDKALELDDKNVDANNMMALYQWRIRQTGEADKYFRKAIDHGPKNPESLNNYAVFLCEQGKIDDAITYYDRAIAVPVYNAKLSAYTNAGKCLLKKKDNKRAAGYFKEALKLSPYFPDANMEMAKLEARSGQLISARKYLAQYFFKGPKTAEMVYLAMRVEETLGNKKEATAYAKELLAGFPESQEAIWVKNRMKPRR